MPATATARAKAAAAARLAPAPRARRRRAPWAGAARPAAGRAAAAPARTRRRAPRRRPAARRPGTGRFVPVAVGRTAVAIGGLADSGLFVRLTRGRLWIAALAALLVGIVALNVLALSFSASSSRTARQAEELAQENSELRSRIVDARSDDRVQAAAARLGFSAPAPDAIHYLRASADDAAVAARRLRSGELGDGGATATPAAAAPEPSAAPDPAATADPATAAPAPAPGSTAGADPAVATSAPADPAAGTNQSGPATAPAAGAPAGADSAAAPSGGIAP